MSEEDLRHAKLNDPLMPPSRAKLAVPFISKDVPAPASEFAQPDVVIGLTFLAYRIQGLRVADFTNAIDTLIRDFESESGPKHERRAAERYAEWLERSGTDGVGNSDVGLGGNSGGFEALSLQSLDRTDEFQMKWLYERWRMLPEFIHWVLDHILFPELMKFQDQKLTASGVDMGGKMLFSRRIGFSGTPSDLLPRDLGKCQFEPGSEGDILSTLTNTDIVSAERLKPAWDASFVLKEIASKKSSDGKGCYYHALIDVGAMITGLSNLEVAKFLVSEESYLVGVEGVVFLDEGDNKMICALACNRFLPDTTLDGTT
jgi:hypothetical protein